MEIDLAYSPAAHPRTLGRLLSVSASNRVTFSEDYVATSDDA
jgi:hypothetical protein